jgi:hypothetical protein
MHVLGGAGRCVRRPRLIAPTGMNPDKHPPRPLGSDGHPLRVPGSDRHPPPAPDLCGYERYRGSGVRLGYGAPRPFAPMGMNCVLLAPTGMWLKILAPMGRGPDQHPPRQPQAPGRKAADADAPPNGLHQPQAGTSTGSVDRERAADTAAWKIAPIQPVGLHALLGRPELNTSYADS